MKKVIALALAIVMMVSLCACSAGTGAASTTQDGPIKIGLIAAADAEGKLAVYYNEIALQMVNDLVADSSLGNRIEIIRNDCGNDESEMQQNMTDLKSQGCVAIMVIALDSWGPAAAQWAKVNEIPVLWSLNYTTEMSIKNYSDYTFSTALNMWGFVKVIATEAVSKRGFEDYVYVGVDGAGADDFENLMMYESQKYNPDFKSLGSYRMDYTDSQFSTIVATIMSMEKVPDMTLQYGGYNVMSFIQQATQYDFYSKSNVWSDVITSPMLVPSLVAAGIYSFDGTYSATPMAWWNDDFSEFVDAYTAKSNEIYGMTYDPVEYALYFYWSGKALVTALENCVANGTDYTDGAALAEAIEAVSFKDCGQTHTFRDFDHQLTMNMYFVEAVDGGEEYNHNAIPKDIEDVYTPDEYLPTKEEVAAYAASQYGITR